MKNWIKKVLFVFIISVSLIGGYTVSNIKLNNNINMSELSGSVVQIAKAKSNKSDSNTVSLSETEGGCPKVAVPGLKLLYLLVFRVLEIAVPILLIVMASVQLIKAVMAGDDKTNKEVFSSILKKCIIAVLFFFIITIIKIVLTRLGSTAGVSNTNDWLQCWKYISKSV